LHLTIQIWGRNTTSLFTEEVDGGIHFNIYKLVGEEVLKDFKRENMMGQILYTRTMTSAGTWELETPFKDTSDNTAIIKITGLPLFLTDKGLYEIFSKFGKCHCVLLRSSDKNMAMARFDTKENATRAEECCSSIIAKSIEKTQKGHTKRDVKPK